MAYSLEGHVALVTGSSTGLGKGIALRLGQAGAKVAINYFNNQQRAEAAFDEFHSAGCTGMLIRGDASSEQDVPRMCQAIKDELGAIDILVPNATPDQPQKPIEQYDWAFYQQMLDFFVKSPFLLTQACIADMKAKTKSPSKTPRGTIP